MGDPKPCLSIETADEGDEFELAGDDAGHLGILRERLARVAAGKGQLLVARWADELVGHIYLWWEPADERALRKRLPDTPLLMNLWVRKDHRNKGIGTALVEEAERRLKKRSCTRVALGVELDNKIAIKFYLGRDYYPWPHKDLMTHYDEFMADGTRTVGEEICAVLMKDLGLFQILRSVLRRRAKSGRGALLLAGR